MTIAGQRVFPSERCRDCGWKLIYEDEGQARAELHRIRTLPRYKKPRRKLHVYKCPWGNGWHIGHTKRT